MYDSSTDYYRVLGVATNATPGDIKCSFNRLVKQFHPDKLHNNFNIRNNHDAAAHFKEIKLAYEVLSNGALRREYDTARQPMITYIAYICCNPFNVYRY